MKYLLMILAITMATPAMADTQDTEDFYNCVEDSTNEDQLEACHVLYDVYELDASEMGEE